MSYASISLYCSKLYESCLRHVPLVLGFALQIRLNNVQGMLYILNFICIPNAKLDKGSNFVVGVFLKNEVR